MCCQVGGGGGASEVSLRPGKVGTTSGHPHLPAGSGLPLSLLPLPQPFCSFVLGRYFTLTLWSLPTVLWALCTKALVPLKCHRCQRWKGRVSKQRKPLSLQRETWGWDRKFFTAITKPLYTMTEAPVIFSLQQNASVEPQDCFYFNVSSN